MRYVSAVVVAAGEGKRLHSRIPKLLVKINSTPLIIHCLKVLNAHPLISEIILVVNKKQQRQLIRKLRPYGLRKISCITCGGRRRQDSVYKGLECVGKQSALVLVHDGARPFISRAIVTQAIKEAARTGAAIVAVPVKATIKEGYRLQATGYSKNIVNRTLERDKLWEVQTPQVFRKEVILRAYRKFGHLDVTDDATLVEKLGIKVNLVRGLYNNIKITTPEDLILAEAICQAQRQENLN
jgi:2-C-methyl-D-erythritol 4-phosphate cytidylyltransferase